MAAAKLPVALEGYGLTYRQYDHWASNGWIDVPLRRRGDNASRGTLRFSPEQLTRIRLMVALVCSLGLPPSVAAQLLDSHVVASQDGHVVIALPGITLEVKA